MRQIVLEMALTVLISSLFVTPAGDRAEAAGRPNSKTAAAEVRSDAGGAGAICGIVKFAGRLPKPARIDMAQEPACERMHGGRLTIPTVVGGPGDTLADVVVYISGGLDGRRYETPAEPVMIDQKGCMFSPHVLGLRVNQKLLVYNSDPTMHTVHPLPAYNPPWNRSQMVAMPPIETSFTHEEIAIPVKCNVHPWMKSFVAVFAHPFFAVTRSDGAFELRNMPPGTYTVTAWHESLGTCEQKVTLRPGETMELEFTLKSNAE